MLRKLLLMLALTGFAMTIHAQTDQQGQTDKELKKSFIYQWTDEKGVVHIADGLDKVPKGYRDKAIKLNQPKNEDAGQGQQAQQPSVKSPSDAASEAADASAKAAWQQRMRDARQRLANAESRYQALAQRRDELLRSWGGPASGQLAGRAEAGRVEREMKDVQAQIDEAQKDIDVVIPENARKAGIPPGWLRE